MKTILLFVCIVLVFVVTVFHDANKLVKMNRADQILAPAQKDGCVVRDGNLELAKLRMAMMLSK